MSTPIEEFLSYAHFCRTLWDPAVGADNRKDLIVMGYGLPGEWGEVAEVLAEGLPTTAAARAHLVEELGDVAYYWGRLAGAYKLNVASLVAGVIAEAGAGPVESLEPVAVAALRMSAAAGRVADVLKKEVRDGVLDSPLLHDSMRRTLLHWGTICAMCGIEWRDVLAANRIKVAARQAAANEATAEERASEAA